MQADLLKWLLRLRGERLTAAERRQLLLRGLVGAVLVGLVTLALWRSGEAYGWFERLSYDLPHILKQRRPSEVRMVYMSETAALALGQSFGVWNRSIHAELIRRLKDAGAKAIFFDLVLIEPGESIGLDPQIDESLHAAIRDHGQVYFGAMFDPREKTVGGLDLFVQTVVPPYDALLEAVGDHWGLLAFSPVDSDYAVRRYYGGTMYVPSTTWALANEIGAGLGDDPEERGRERWLNYYGPPESVSPDGKGRDFTFDSLDYHTVLKHPDQVPEDFFRGKVVFVGLRNQLGTVNVGKDEFRHPLSRWSGRYSAGIEVHATAFLNLLKHEWLRRFDRRGELVLVLLLGGLLALTCTRAVPWLASVVTVLAMMVVGGLGFWIQLHHRVWFNWSLPVTLAPLALFWGVTTRYAVVERRRAGLRRALASYLSEDVAAAMVDQGFELKLGGELRFTTAMFTDIEGFTTLAQKLAPGEVARVLSAYFQRINPHIHENGGAILRYAGDAIVAVWNAPRHCVDHAERACAAAREIARLNAEPLAVEGQPLLVDGEPLRLRTRIGVHTGSVIACNVGSRDRFDFTVLGDNVNLAARLEGLNKYFQTTALTTRSSVILLRNSGAVRCLGTIIVKGRNKGVRVYELVDEPIDPAFQSKFMQAVVLLAKGRIQAARAAFLALKEARPNDGPSRFYLDRIEKAQTAWPLVMEEK